MINEALELSPSISGVQRYMNLWFLLCLSLLRPFNLLGNEIVWQICCSLLLLMVPMGFIFSCPNPSPLAPPHACSGQKRNREAITWKYRCPTMKSFFLSVCLPWAPQAGGHAPLVCWGLTLIEVFLQKMWKNSIPSPRAGRSFSICCTCSWAQSRAVFCPPLPARRDLNL